MNPGLGNNILPGDPRLIDHIVSEVMSQGIFDQFRKECIADVDTKPAYQNLRARVESSVNCFLSQQRWKADLNKNQLRETLRKHISDGPYLDTGVERIVDQVVNPKIYSVFMPQVEDVVYEFMGLEKPKREKNGKCGLKDLLPKDLDPVSPESDKNSLKDISLDSVDANLTAPGEKDDWNLEGISKGSLLTNEVEAGNVFGRLVEYSNVSMEEKSDKSISEVLELHRTTSISLGLDGSIQSVEKEEDEEASPVFEAIDIMNLHESNFSNDSRLSDISALTSHRSGSFDFSNDLSRDNFEISNQDSHLSKVSSDSRLSIITDFGSSNQPTTPIPDVEKDENSRDQFASNNFNAIGDEGCQSEDKIIDVIEQKDIFSERKDGNDPTRTRTNLSAMGSSRDGHERFKEESDRKLKEKGRDSIKIKLSKGRSDYGKSRSHRSHKKVTGKQQSTKSKLKNSGLPKLQDRSENSKDSTDKPQQVKELKEDKETPTKFRDVDLKDSSNKEGKALKDIYKKKIREFREKKELTEKGKTNKGQKERNEFFKDDKFNRDLKEKQESSQDKKKYRSFAYKTNASTHERIFEKSSKDDVQSSKGDVKEKSKRDESHRFKEMRERDQSESNDISAKSTDKKVLNIEKDGKAKPKQDSKFLQKRSWIDSNPVSTSADMPAKHNDLKDKKRKDDKKAKSKDDDHSSLRKTSNDRRSSDRDGSSGSSGKGSQKSNTSPSTSSKPSTTTLSNESNTNSHSGSGTLENIDGINEGHSESEKSGLEKEQFNPIAGNLGIKKGKPDVKVEKLAMQEEKSVLESTHIHEPAEIIILKESDEGQGEISLPLKKRPIQSEEEPSCSTKLPMKNPKFARNFVDAKKIMKIQKKTDKSIRSHSSVDSRSSLSELSETLEGEVENSPLVLEPEALHMIRVKGQDEVKPYSWAGLNLPFVERSKIILTSDSTSNTNLVELKTKSMLSEMESSIIQSLNEMISAETHEDNVRILLEGPPDSEEIQDIAHAGYLGNNNKTDTTDDVSMQMASGTRADLKDKFDVPQKAAELLSAHVCISDNSVNHIENKHQKIRDGDIEEQRESWKELEKLEPSTGQLSKDSEFSADEDCLYFLPDNEILNRFTQFMISLHLRPHSPNDAIREGHPYPEPKFTQSITTAPPQRKRKSMSPLSEFLLTSNNNNDGHKLEATMYKQEGLPAVKTRRLGRPRKQGLNTSPANPPILNGENFGLPTSPESDVSATSDINSVKEERNRPRGNNQRYTSDDLYKPRPLFARSSRRSRRSNT